MTDTLPVIRHCYPTEPIPKPGDILTAECGVKSDPFTGWRTNEELRESVICGQCFILFRDSEMKYRQTIVYGLLDELAVEAEANHLTPDDIREIREGLELQLEVRERIAPPNP